MDLENIWKQSSGNDDELDKMLQEDFKHLQSRHPLLKLKKLVFKDMILSLSVMTIYITFPFFSHHWQTYLSSCIIIIMCISILSESWRLYKQMPSLINPTNSLKEELERNYKSFQRWWSIQLKFFWFGTPIFTASFFSIPGVLSSGKTVDPSLYIFSVLGSLAILMPTVYYATIWAYNRTYGKHLKKLKSMIDELST